MKLKVGDKVEWTSSHNRKTGEVIAVVPAGEKSGKHGYNPNGCQASKSMSRDRESYIVGVRRPYPDNDKFYAKNFWPVISLLKKIS